MCYVFILGFQSTNYRHTCCIIHRDFFTIRRSLHVGDIGSNVIRFSFGQARCLRTILSNFTSGHHNLFVVDGWMLRSGIHESLFGKDGIALGFYNSIKSGRTLCNIFVLHFQSTYTGKGGIIVHGDFFTIYRSLSIGGVGSDTISVALGQACCLCAEQTGTCTFGYHSAIFYGWLMRS